MKNQIKGCVRINAEGKNLYKFINNLHNSDIDCFAQYCSNNIFYAEIYRRDLKKVRNIAEKLDIKISSSEYSTVSSTLIRNKKRFGITIGIIFALTATLYFSNIIMTIEIQGNTTVSDTAILSALEQLNIRQGTPIRKINFPYCENELRLMVDGVAWAGMHITGNRVVVEVTELVEKPEMLRKRVPCNVVSGKDAYITYTSVHDGQLMHKVGDYVPRGTLLINGVTKDETGHISTHHAMGTIRGTYSETVIFEENYKIMHYNPTGKTFKEKWLELFSFKIPLFFGKNTFSYFTSETSSRYADFFGKKLPIGITKNIISETELSETDFSDEELAEKIMEKIYLYEKNFLTDDVNITKRNIETEKTENSLIYTVTYELEGEIGVEREILAK
ncbi:MAG: sporulation protein YqfD [Ruminococcus sp.]|nr:sporulation protein YqfD [Ruminococcus sp.]